MASLEKPHTLELPRVHIVRPHFHFLHSVQGFTSLNDSQLLASDLGLWVISIQVSYLTRKTRVRTEVDDRDKRIVSDPMDKPVFRNLFKVLNFLSFVLTLRFDHRIGPR